MKRTWSEEQIDILKVEYYDANLDELAGKLGKTRGAIKTFAQKIGLKRSENWIFWTKEKKAKLRDLYPKLKNIDLAKIFYTSEYSINAIAFKMNLFKSDEFHRTHRAKGQYKKGRIPENKGKKQKEYMYKESIERTKATRFQKGNIPPNTVPIGYERLDKDGYIYTKVEGKRRLIQKHRHVWEQHFGPIPKGNNIQFKDGDRQNCSIENLYMISRADQMKKENSGSKNLPDGIVALYIAGRHGKDKDLIETIKNNHPELIELKRNQILLNRKIKEQNGSNRQTKTNDR